MWLLALVFGLLNISAVQPSTPKVAEPLLQDIKTKSVKAKLLKSKGLDKNLLSVTLGVSYMKDNKWKEAYNTFNKAPKIEYLDRYIKYFKAVSEANAFEDEKHLKDALDSLYSLSARGGSTSENIQQDEARAEIKLALIKANAKDYVSALDFLSRARKNNYSNIESEFNLIRLFAGWDKKISQEFMLELYKRFGDKTKPYFDKLDVQDRTKLKDAIGGLSKKEQQEVSKTQQQIQQLELFDSIKLAVDKKDYSEFKSLSEDYLRKYNKYSYNKKLSYDRNFYSVYTDFMEDAIFSKKYSASYFDGVFEYCDKAYIEKLALKLWQTSDWKNSEHVLNFLYKKFPLYDKALFLMASFYEDIDKKSKATDYYKKLIEDFPQSDYYQRSLFKYAWFKMLAGDYRTCTDTYGRYLAEGGESYDWAITSALYFQSRCLAKQSKQEEANAVKQDLMARYPFSFYSLLSMDELGIDVVKALDDSIKPQSYTEDAISPSDVYVINTASLLIRAGLLDWAKKELGTINLDHLSSEYLELVSDLYRYANMHDMAFMAAGKLLLNLKGYSSREHAQTHFPKPYMELVASVSKATGIEPFVIFAIMKRESAFNKDAVSKSGAQGLMQLIPYTANRFDPTVDEKKLKDAETNLRLASLYLEKLFEKYNGNLVYISAAYNAGEKNLDRWIEWYGSRLDDVEFIENIPYLETRAYVKSVISNYYMYNALYLKKKIDFNDVMRLKLKKGE